MKILVEFEFDENELGPKWMNIDNLKTLLYTDTATLPELFKILRLEEKETLENLGVK